MFVLTKTTIDVDSGVIDTEVVIASEDFDKVSKEMKTEIKSARQDFEDSDYEEDDYCDGDMSYSIWEEGWGMSQRLILTIHEVQVQ